MTLFEYNIRMKAKQYQLVDKERDIYFQAWLNLVAKSTKSKGKKQEYIYNKFDKFFNYEKALNDIDRKESGIKDIDKNRKELIKQIAKLNNREEE